MRNSPCQAVYSLQRTCIIQADTCAMPSVRVDSVLFPLPDYPSSLPPSYTIPRRTWGWPCGEIKMRWDGESATLPRRRPRKRHRRDGDEDDDNGARLMCGKEMLFL